MKRFSCGDVVPGCSKSWEASSDDALLRQVADHASSAHGLDELSADVRQRVLEHTHEVTSAQ